jgi:four helix bundle protein
VADGVEGGMVLRRADALSLELHRASLTWPKVEQYGGIAGQVRRSSPAVCALLAEGVGRSRTSRPGSERYVVMALGSADEAKPVVSLCRSSRLCGRRTGGGLAGLSGAGLSGAGLSGAGLSGGGCGHAARHVGSTTVRSG